MKHTIMLFLKIGSLKNITELYENGTVFMNPINYFKKIEDGFLRGDKHEGALSLTTPQDATISFSLMDKEFKPVSIWYGEFLKTGNLYSLYSVSSYGFPSPKDFKFDKKNLEFGSHCLMIKQPDVFLNCLKAGLRKKGLRFEHGFVKYYEEQIEQKDLTPFHKLNAFEYQKEFRFFVESKVNEPLIINIGSMKSYTEIYETKDMLGLELK